MTDQTTGQTTGQTTTEYPQIYLVSPPQIGDGFVQAFEAVLDSRPIACFRLALAEKDEEKILHTADRMREICHARDIAIVIERHVLLAERLGLDGVHLADSSARVRDMRKALGRDAIIGVHCGSSRHAGLVAAEAGADYISFGPVAPSALGDGAIAETDLFAWWSEMIEVPVVAEGGLTAALVEGLAPMVDFLAVGDEIWSQDNPRAALEALLAPLG